MRRVILISVLCFLSVFLISCVTVKKNTTEMPKAKGEYAKLVFMGDECVAWFSPDLNIIGRADIAEYFTENQIKPKEAEILNHFASLGWEVVGTPKKDKYTTEYQLKR